jgi:hypothetical protein
MQPSSQMTLAPTNCRRRKNASGRNGWDARRSTVMNQTTAAPTAEGRGTQHGADAEQQQPGGEHPAVADDVTH